MIYLYIACLAIGSIFIGISLFGGDSHDHVGDTDAHMDDIHGEVDVPWYFGKYFPLLSMRFWVFFLFFFGLAGLGAYLANSSPSVQLIWSIIMGVITGYLANFVFKKIRETETNSLVEQKDFIGAEAEVVLPIHPGKMGKIRCIIKSQMIEQLAVSDEESAMYIGDKVVIISFQGDKVQVIKNNLNNI